MPQSSNKENAFDTTFDDIAGTLPVVVTRRGVIVMGVIIGLTIAAVVAFMWWQNAGLSREVHSRTRSDERVRELARQVFPSEDQFKVNIVHALKLCQREPECQREFRKVLAREVATKKHVHEP